VLPVHAEAAKKGLIEISTSLFIIPLCRWFATRRRGRLVAGLPLPQNRFRHPEDAPGALQRGMDLHKKVFGVRPHGVWPSEGSVSAEAIGIAHELGVKWMATDEGVLGRSLGVNFSRDGYGHLNAEGARQLYTIYRYEQDETRMNLLFATTRFRT